MSSHRDMGINATYTSEVINSLGKLSNWDPCKYQWLLGRGRIPTYGLRSEVGNVHTQRVGARPSEDTATSGRMSDPYVLASSNISVAVLFSKVPKHESNNR
jgi:hypothetical protein